MSDTRFIILAVGIIFAGIIILSVFGAQFDEITMQEEFHVCYEYHADMPPTEIDCDIASQNKIIVFVRIERISSTTFGTSESKICFF